MVWNKLKKELESFLNPGMIAHISYLAAGYRYNKRKQARCYIQVNGQEIFNMDDHSTGIQWYQTEQEVKNDALGWMHVTKEEIQAVKGQVDCHIPEERLRVIARDRKRAQYAKDIISGQKELEKNDFQRIANTFMTSPINESLMSDDIMLNVLAIIDRRVGSNRLIKMRSIFEMKHPVVRFVYNLRLEKPKE